MGPLGESCAESCSVRKAIHFEGKFVLWKDVGHRFELDDDLICLKLQIQ